MTREEFYALLKEREAVQSKLRQFSDHVCEVLAGVGYHNDGKANVKDITFANGMASITYLERAAHASCCGDDWETAKIPANWIFGGDWKAEYAAQEAATLKAEQDQVEAEEKASREAQEAHDKAEFERLKAKFDSPTAGKG